MISFDFEYYKPASIKEATLLFKSLDKEGKDPIYLSGGTELITLGRDNQIMTRAVIDLKGIPECLVLKRKDGKIILGAAQSLTKIRNIDLFPFLNKAIIEIADHTARNKITLGGNICANIIYRETVLPLLLTNSEVVISTDDGLKQVPLNDIFHQKLKLKNGEFLVQVITDQHEVELPFLCIKKRRQWDVGYPLLTVAALKRKNQIQVAFSGLCSFPFRNKEIDESLNDQHVSKKSRVEEAIQRIPAPVLDDLHGSAEYRQFVLRNTLYDVLDALEGASNV